MEGSACARQELYHWAAPPDTRMPAFLNYEDFKNFSSVAFSVIWGFTNRKKNETF